MLYRNIKTGVIVSVPSPVCGDWEPVVKQAPVAVQAEVTEEPTEMKKPVKRATKKKTR